MLTGLRQERAALGILAVNLEGERDDGEIVGDMGAHRADRRDGPMFERAMNGVQVSI